METPLVLPKATARGGVRHPGSGFFPVLGLNLTAGVPVYFCAFVFAYAFADSVGWSEHLTFLVVVAVYSVITGFLASFLAACRYPESAVHIVGAGILTSLAINAIAVGIGSIASATSKDQGSVSVDFSTTTDIVVALSLFGFALACAYAAAAVRRSDR